MCKLEAESSSVPTTSYLPGFGKAPRFPTTIPHRVLKLKPDTDSVLHGTSIYKIWPSSSSSSLCLSPSIFLWPVVNAKDL